MPDHVTPVLSTGIDQIVDDRDQIAYLIRHAYYNPGWTSSYLENRLVSMRRLFADSERNVSEMAGRLKEKLEFSLSEMFGTGVYRPVINVVKEDDLSTTVSIGILDAKGAIVLTCNDIRVANGELYIKEDFDNGEE